MSVPLPVILVVLAVTLAVGVWAVGDLAAGLEQRRRLAARASFGEQSPVDGLFDRMDVRLRRTDLGRALALRLAASGLRLRVSTFLMLLVATAVFAVILIGKWMAPLFGVAAAAGVAWAFFAFLRRREDRRKEAFIAQLPDLARVLSNATNAGLALRTAIEIAADELDDPARTELRRTADALRLGQSLEDALRDLAQRLPSRELGVLVSTLVVSSRAGGSLVTALRTIAATLEERKETRREIKTIMGEAVVSNWAIGVLGIGSVVMINLFQPGALRAMSASLVGQIMLGVAAVLFVLSLVVIGRITRIDV
ncbi:Bacterial type II secretion system protein F domain protein [Actinomadura rubteroloni]|uniref:Bacterial type II secretion system protein F domain protein n=1 Tax=Actinomadura rubteroloni TaxID=1926885 RepID=A0A2P4UJ54_9ACTN|nr:type II secretion system F family protein [Actinomadura rubteroloni]POM25060.1 Bacterial type II secretion system protein F domain protein [Actinomadura rubteroloni]